jgi:hypothetical protein
MLEELAGSEVGKHLLLDLEEHGGEVDGAGVGVASHEFRIGEELGESGG